MNNSSSSDQNINVKDLRVDLSKYKLFQLLDNSDENQKRAAPDIDTVNSFIEDGKKLKDEIEKKLQTYYDANKPKEEKQNQEKKQANNQKLKNQSLNNPVQPIRPSNIPNNQLNSVDTKDRSQQRNQREASFYPNNPRINKHGNNQSRHHDKKNVSKSTDNEKPLRIPSEKVNKNGVWFKSEPFFQNLPKKEDIDKIFSIIDKTVENRKLQASEQNEGVVCHYSERLNHLVHNKMRRVPSPPPDINDISEFWKENQLPFQIETMQKRRFSCFHYLINSFVELDSLPPKGTESNSPDLSQSQNDNNCHSGKNREPNPIANFSLLPQIVSETYMALSFDDRLLLELESLGLNQPTGNPTKRISPFEEEIEEKTKESDQTISELKEMRDFINDNFDNFCMQQQKRNRLTDETLSLLAKKSNSGKQSK